MRWIVESLTPLAVSIVDASCRLALRFPGVGMARIPLRACVAVLALAVFLGYRPK